MNGDDFSLALASFALGFSVASLFYSMLRRR